MKLDAIKFNEAGLVPAIVQEASSEAPGTGRVLMMAWMDVTAVEKTAETGLMHYWSRSRQKHWLKGESSGHTQRVIRWYVDCDGDTLLFEVEQNGGACHTGYESCFFQRLERDGSRAGVNEPKIFDPETVYQ